MYLVQKHRDFSWHHLIRQLAIAFIVLIAHFAVAGDQINLKTSIPFTEALKILQERAIFLDQPIDAEKIAEISLQTFLSQHDLYSQYLNPEEYRQFKAAQQENYVGLGMELRKQANGEILCFPYPGSASEKAGIQNGDRLLEINGKTVTGKAFFSLTSLVSGKAGTPVELLVASADTQPRKVIARLSDTQIKSVSLNRLNNIVVVKISFFSSQTKFELIEAMNQLPLQQAIVFDLRGNPGGDFYAALECADLFVPEGNILITAQSKIQKLDYHSSKIKKYFHSKLFIWQDHDTASAAEVFSVALAENNVAISIGEKSYGKGSKQNIFELSNGSALVLTTDYLITANGLHYNGVGLVPMILLRNNPPQTSNYSEIVEKLFKN